MGIFGTSKADLIKEVAKTGTLLTAALNDLQIERTQHGHTKAELARLTTRGPGGRFVKVAPTRTNGTAAAYPIPGSAADVSPATHRTIS